MGKRKRRKRDRPCLSLRLVKGGRLWLPTEVREGGESFDEGRLGREARSRAVGRLAQALTQAEKLHISM